MKQVLIIDDEEIVIETLKIILDNFSVNVIGCTDPVEGSEIAIRTNFDLILLDLKMPEMNGTEIAFKVLRAKADAKILMITSSPMDPLIEKALTYGVMGVVKKPFEIDKILNFLEVS